MSRESLQESIASPPGDGAASPLSVCSASNAEAIVSTPPKRKQRSLYDYEAFNQLSCEKQKKPADDAQELSNRKISKMVSEQSMVVFREKMKKLKNEQGASQDVNPARGPGATRPRCVDGTEAEWQTSEIE